MAEITRRRSGELVRGVFQILLSNPDGLQAKEVLSRLQTAVPPTEFEKTMYAERPNVRRYEKIVRFSTIGPVKAGWLTKKSWGRNQKYVHSNLPPPVFRIFRFVWDHLFEDDCWGRSFDE